jgi:hypothetical protein
LIDAVVFGERNTKKGFFSRLFSWLFRIYFE